MPTLSWAASYLELALNMEFKVRWHRDTALLGASETKAAETSPGKVQRDPASASA